MTATFTPPNRGDDGRSTQGSPGSAWEELRNRAARQSEKPPQEKKETDIWSEGK